MLKTAEAEKYKCKYCDHEFKRETSLVVHMCEQKRRHTTFNDKDIQYGFHTYNKFYQYSQDPNKTKTPEEFMKSAYYKAFVKFGRYIVNTKCIKIDRFMMFVIRSGIKLDNWASDKTYTKFIDEAVKTESVTDALMRSIAYSEQWAEDKKMKPHDLLRYGSQNRITQAIIAGHISPWVLYQSDTGVDFLGKLSSEQMTMIWDIIDPKFWNATFESADEDVQTAKTVLGELGW